MSKLIRVCSARLASLQTTTCSARSAAQSVLPAQTYLATVLHVKMWMLICICNQESVLVHVLMGSSQMPQVGHVLIAKQAALLVQALSLVSAVKQVYSYIKVIASKSVRSE